MPLGGLTVDLLASGFIPLRPTSHPLSLTVKPPKALLRAADQIQKKAAVSSEGPPGPRFPTSEVQESGNGGFVQHYSTGDIYWHQQSGANWVYGAILAKYIQRGGPSGRLGYPLTDETGCADQLGRFNHFQAGSIYYSPQTGAHNIQGQTLGHWRSLGSEMAYLGYPTTDPGERPTNFERGTITTIGGDLGDHFDASDSRIIKTGVMHIDGAAANGWTELLISSNGAWHYKGSMRSTGALSYDVVMATLLKANDQAIAFVEEGDVEGTFVWGGNRAHTWDLRGVDVRITDNWELWRNARAETKMTVAFGAGDFLAILGSGLAVIGIVVAHILSPIFGKPKLKPCGWVKQRRFDHHTGEEKEENLYLWVPEGDTCPREP
ncbi:LGFP repeat-containing protein [Streptomyces cinereoruber]|uniref:LGFP repeat-containing protein n=1 Tax=Streptomyces cinereoruber TaxID=67260 RepID=UPI00362BB856